MLRDRISSNGARDVGEKSVLPAAVKTLHCRHVDTIACGRWLCMKAEWRWLPLTKNVRELVLALKSSAPVWEKSVVKKRGLARPEPKKHKRRAFHSLINFSIALNWEKLISSFQIQQGGIYDWLKSYANSGGLTGRQTPHGEHNSWDMYHVLSHTMESWSIFVSKEKSSFSPSI